VNAAKLGLRLSFIVPLTLAGISLLWPGSGLLGLVLLIVAALMVVGIIGEAMGLRVVRTTTPKAMASGRAKTAKPDPEAVVRTEIHTLACERLYPNVRLTMGQHSTEAWTFEEMVFEACKTRGWQRNFRHPDQTTEKVAGPWRFQVGNRWIEGERADMDKVAQLYEAIATIVRDSKAGRALRGG
jgi:hypothetical protein